MNLHSIEHIQQRLDFIQGILEAHYDSDDGNILSTRLQEVGAYMAEAGKLKADSELYYDKAVNKGIIEMLEKMPEYTSGTVQNKLVKSVGANLKYLVTYADRVNRSCTHQLEVMRTQLSYIKSLPR